MLILVYRNNLVDILPIIKLPLVQATLEIPRSMEFQLELLGIGGYDISETDKIIEQM